MQEPLAPGIYLVLDRGIWEHERQRYPAGSPIPWSEAVRLRLPEVDGMNDESAGGGVIGAPPPVHTTVPGVQTRPPTSSKGKNPRTVKRNPKENGGV